MKLNAYGKVLMIGILVISTGTALAGKSKEFDL